MADRRIRFGIGFDVDDSALKQIKQSFKEIQSLTPTEMIDYGKSKNLEEAKKDLAELQNSALQLQGVLDRSFSKDLGTVNIQKFNEEIKKVDIAKIARDFNQAGPTGQQALARITSQAVVANTKVREVDETMKKLFVTLSNTIRWSISTTILQGFTGKFQEAWGYVKGLDKDLNDIRIVTGKSADEMERFGKQANEAAKALGASTRDVAQAALIYYQQGDTDADAMAKAQITQKAANVTGQSTAETSEGLTAVWNGYQVASEAAEKGMGAYESYVDKMAAVAASTASDLEEQTTAMSKVASTAKTLGISFDDLNAQISTIESITRKAPESVGTSLKTIYARIADLKIDPSATDEWGVSLGQVSKQLKDAGIEILDTNGDLRNMTEVMSEVGSKWQDWSATQKQAVAIAIGGKRQYTDLMALFENWGGMYADALATSQNAAGTLNTQQAIYMQSLEAAQKKMQTAWEKTFEAMFDEDSMRTVYEILENIGNALGYIVDTLGGGLNTFVTIGALLTNMFSGQIASGISVGLTNFSSFIQEIKNGTKPIDEFYVSLSKLSDGSQSEAILNYGKQMTSLQKYLTPEQRERVQQRVKKQAELENEYLASMEKKGNYDKIKATGVYGDDDATAVSNMKKDVKRFSGITSENEDIYSRLLKAQDKGGIYSEKEKKQAAAAVSEQQKEYNDLLNQTEEAEIKRLSDEIEKTEKARADAQKKIKDSGRKQANISHNKPAGKKIEEETNIYKAEISRQKKYIEEYTKNIEELQKKKQSLIEAQKPKVEGKAQELEKAKAQQVEANRFFTQEDANTTISHYKAFKDKIQMMNTDQSDLFKQGTVDALNQIANSGLAEKMEPDIKGKIQEAIESGDINKMADLLENNIEKALKDGTKDGSEVMKSILFTELPSQMKGSLEEGIEGQEEEGKRKINKEEQDNIAQGMSEDEKRGRLQKNIDDAVTLASLGTQIASTGKAIVDMGEAGELTFGKLVTAAAPLALSIAPVIPQLSGMSANLKKLGGGALIITGLILAIDALSDSVQEVNARAEKARNTYEETNSKIQDLNNQIEQNKAKIDEMKESEYVDSEEITKLEHVNTLLERQKESLEAILEVQKDASVKASNQALQFSFEGGAQSMTNSGHGLKSFVQNGVNGLKLAKSKMFDEITELTDVSTEGYDVNAAIRRKKELQEELNSLEDKYRAGLIEESAYVKQSGVYREKLSNIETNLTNVSTAYTEEIQRQEEMGVDTTALQQKNLEILKEIDAVSAETIEKQQKKLNLDKEYGELSESVKSTLQSLVNATGKITEDLLTDTTRQILDNVATSAGVSLQEVIDYLNENLTPEAFSFTDAWANVGGMAAAGAELGLGDEDKNPWDGLINSAKEYGTVLKNNQDLMDLTVESIKSMNSEGEISYSQALKLVEANEDYYQALEWTATGARLNKEKLIELTKQKIKDKIADIEAAKQAFITKKAQELMGDEYSNTAKKIKAKIEMSEKEYSFEANLQRLTELEDRARKKQKASTVIDTTMKLVRESLGTGIYTQTLADLRDKRKLTSTQQVALTELRDMYGLVTEDFMGAMRDWWAYEKLPSVDKTWLESLASTMNLSPRAALAEGDKISKGDFSDYREAIISSAMTSAEDYYTKVTDKVSDDAFAEAKRRAEAGEYEDYNMLTSEGKMMEQQLNNVVNYVGNALAETKTETKTKTVKSQTSIKNPFESLVANKDTVKNQIDKYKKQIDENSKRYAQALKDGNMEEAQRLLDENEKIAAEAQNYIATNTKNLRENFTNKITELLNPIAPDLVAKGLENITPADWHKVSTALQNELDAANTELEKANESGDQTKINAAQTRVNKASQNKELLDDIQSAWDVVNTTFGFKSGEGEFSQSWADLSQKAILEDAYKEMISMITSSGDKAIEEYRKSNELAPLAEAVLQHRKEVLTQLREQALSLNGGKEDEFTLSVKEQLEKDAETLIAIEKEVYDRTITELEKIKSDFSKQINLLDENTTTFYQDKGTLLASQKAVDEDMLARTLKFIEETKAKLDENPGNASLAKQLEEAEQKALDLKVALKSDEEALKELNKQRLEAFATFENTVKDLILAAYEDKDLEAEIDAYEKEIKAAQKAADKVKEANKKKIDALNDYLDTLQKQWKIEDQEAEHQDKLEERNKAAAERNKAVTAAASGSLEDFSKIQELQEAVNEKDKVLEEEARDNFRKAIEDAIQRQVDMLQDQNDALDEQLDKMEKQKEVMEEQRDLLQEEKDLLEKNPELLAEKIQDTITNGFTSILGKNVTLGELYERKAKQDGSYWLPNYDTKDFNNQLAAYRAGVDTKGNALALDYTPQAYKLPEGQEKTSLRDFLTAIGFETNNIKYDRESGSIKVTKEGQEYTITKEMLDGLYNPTTQQFEGNAAQISRVLQEAGLGDFFSIDDSLVATQALTDKTQEAVNATTNNTAAVNALTKQMGGTPPIPTTAATSTATGFTATTTSGSTLTKSYDKVDVTPKKSILGAIDGDMFSSAIASVAQNLIASKSMVSDVTVAKAQAQQKNVVQQGSSSEIGEINVQSKIVVQGSADAATLKVMRKELADRDKYIVNEVIEKINGNMPRNGNLRKL
jgi:TP901 family phage tail tape measure protein